MLPRLALQSAVKAALARSRAVVLTGPRQSGKTTLARGLLDRASPHYFDLENPLDAARLEQPMQTLSPLHGLVVIDEVQRRPGLFPVLRVLIDRSDDPGQFLLLGSASPALLRQAGESLLGRVETIEVAGFDLGEVNAAASSYDASVAQQLWLRGGFPRSYLAATDEDSFVWRRNAIASHAEVDLPQFGVNIAAPAMLRFWRMLAHCHGQIWSAADPARSLGVSEPTVRRYLDTLTQTLMVRQLQPWHANLSKRQVKSPKVYFRDSGLLHALMDVTTLPQLLSHPRSGASWEGFAPGPARRGFFLGDAPGRRAGPVDAQRRAAHRRRVQARRCAASDALDAHRHARPWPRHALCRVSGGSPVRSGTRHRGGAARGIARNGVVCRPCQEEATGGFSATRMMRAAPLEALHQARPPFARYFCAASQILSVVAPAGFFVITGSLLPFISVSTVRS
jgi:uncharacterized protein